MLVRLLYASRATQEIDDTLVTSILDRSHKFNLERGITGILCTHAPSKVFLQVLEGGRVAVNALYCSIVRDSRHTDITLLDYAEIPERRFANWRMGRVDLNRVNLSTILRFSESALLDPFSLSGPAAVALIEELTSTMTIVTGDSA